MVDTQVVAALSGNARPNNCSNFVLLAAAMSSVHLLAACYFEQQQIDGNPNSGL